MVPKSLPHSIGTKTHATQNDTPGACRGDDTQVGTGAVIAHILLPTLSRRLAAVGASASTMAVDMAMTVNVNVAMIDQHDPDRRHGRTVSDGLARMGRPQAGDRVKPDDGADQRPIIAREPIIAS
jgi:hypothetical protein